MEVPSMDSIFNSSLPGPLSFPEHVSVGVFLLLAGIFCGLWQVAALITYLANPTTLWSASMLPEVILMLADLASAGLHPFSGSSALFNRWLWGPYGCQAYAFAGFLIGTYQLFLVPFIAVVRCVEPSVGAVNKRKLLRPYLAGLAVLFFLALFWATAPLAGLAKYNQTVVKFICTIDWLHNDHLFLVYIASYTPVVIGVPLIAALIASLILYIRIKRGTHTVEWATPGLEGLVIVGRLFSVYLCFGMYGVVCLWSLLVDNPNEKIPLGVQALPPILVKLVGLFHLIFYFWLNPKLMAAFFSVFGCGSQCQSGACRTPGTNYPLLGGECEYANVEPPDLHAKGVSTTPIGKLRLQKSTSDRNGDESDTRRQYAQGDIQYADDNI